MGAVLLGGGGGGVAGNLDVSVNQSCSAGGILMISTHLKLIHCEFDVGLASQTLTQQ